MNTFQASTVVADALCRVDLSERAEFLRQVLAHAAAGLVIIEGEQAAAEDCYRLADAVARGVQ